MAKTQIWSDLIVITRAITQATAFKLLDIRTGGVIDHEEIELGKERTAACGHG